MKKTYLILILTILSFNLYAPPNCELYNDDNIPCLESCNLAMKAIRYEQGSFQSQQYFDESIEMCPNFAYSYMEKAVPYLKRGQFIKWKELIDKAVKIAPREYLGYRGWCRLQFLRDYYGAINDIEELKKIEKYDIGYCQTGDYHLNIALALCYKETGNLKKARELFLQQVNTKNYHQGLYDYYHFGILEYEDGNFQQAIEYFKKQIENNDYLGETYYYIAMAYKNLGDIEIYKENLNKSKKYYIDGKFRIDTYTETIDKIYLIDIIKEKTESNNIYCK